MGTWVPRYHVPFSQVHAGSRGARHGWVHLHLALDAQPVTYPAARDIVRKPGQALCRPSLRPWYPRDPDPSENIGIRCPRCVARAERLGITWPEVTP